ncbi:MAG: WXG100 family type VII secretion target [Mycobacterium sp.]|nr:WXG100 family type VII secretion target [Mycobacterium sp.]
MEPDNTLRVDPEAMQGFSASLGGAAEGLRSQLAELDAQVGEMLGGWRGGAGGAYGSAWELWHRGAGEVQLGLSLLAKAVGIAGRDFQTNESASAAVLRGVADG